MAISAAEAIRLEEQYGAHNYHPLPVVLTKGEGVYVWDTDAKRYYDFLSAYSAVNQGHCHPKIVNALVEQSKRLALTSRAFYNDRLGESERYIAQTFGFDKVLLMNSGAEAVETALKICRRWGYEKKKVAQDQALIVVCDQNFHGRTTTIISFSSDQGAKRAFGPYTTGFIPIPYNDTEALAEVLSKYPNIVGFLVEPIQGEAGVNVPDDHYLKSCKDLCTDHNVLLIADEIQTGIARTGKLLASCGNCLCEDRHCSQTPQVKPDILILGKAISGGAYPVSAVLANDAIMEVITPGSHGSTYGGNPVASVVAVAALEVVKEERLAQNAFRLGEYFRIQLKEKIGSSRLIHLVRGKGLLNAIVIADHPNSDTAWNLCLLMKENGLLAKPTHGNIIRFAPPLVITKAQIDACMDIIAQSIVSYEKTWQPQL
jgi:ornithine--oxo-acid transaminase